MSAGEFRDKSAARRGDPARKPEETTSMLKDLWNIAVKVRDLDSELEFLERCGATDIVRDSVRSDAGGEDFAMLRLGPERVLLFPHVIYETELPQPLHYGLTHAVFEVDDLEKELETFAQRGVRPIWGPKEVSATFGRRRIAFFRSPSGFVFEAEQPIDM
jgi:catechol 2,3-dioxygenase-like lactoylglutathione lyase family enzyme